MQGAPVHVVTDPGNREDLCGADFAENDAEIGDMTNSISRRILNDICRGFESHTQSLALVEAPPTKAVVVIQKAANLNRLSYLGSQIGQSCDRKATQESRRRDNKGEARWFGRIWRAKHHSPMTKIPRPIASACPCPASSAVPSAKNFMVYLNGNNAFFTGSDCNVDAAAISPQPVAFVHSALRCCLTWATV